MADAKHFDLAKRTKEIAKRGEFTGMLGEVMQAVARSDHDAAVKTARKMVKMKRDDPLGHQALGMAFRGSDWNQAIGSFRTAMELSDVGTEHHTKYGDAIWAQCASHVFIHLKALSMSNNPHLMKIPSWVTDDVEARRIADRAIAARPDSPYTLRMRALACEAAGDLRQAIRDYKRIAELHMLPGNVDPEAKAVAEQSVRELEAKLKQQIAAKVAELKLAAKTDLTGGEL
jgi:tetratricopeptide (TPR) repeat protein